MLSRDVELGALYAVSLNDCCVEATFTSTLVSMTTDGEGDDEYIVTLGFENGVAVTNALGVHMKKISGRPVRPTEAIQL